MTESSEQRKLKKTMEQQQRQVDEGVLMHIVEQKENWSECTLEDGTVLRVRPVITEVRKLKKLGADGKPAYGHKIALLSDVRHPDKTRKGA